MARVDCELVLVRIRMCHIVQAAIRRRIFYLSVILGTILETELFSVDIVQVPCEILTLETLPQAISFTHIPKFGSLWKDDKNS